MRLNSWQYRLEQSINFMDRNRCTFAFHCGNNTEFSNKMFNLGYILLLTYVLERRVCASQHLQSTDIVLFTSFVLLSFDCHVMVVVWLNKLNQSFHPIFYVYVGSKWNYHRFDHSRVEGGFLIKRMLLISTTRSSILFRDIICLFSSRCAYFIYIFVFFRKKFVCIWC